MIEVLRTESDGSTLYFEHSPTSLQWILIDHILTIRDCGDAVEIKTTHEHIYTSNTINQVLAAVENSKKSTNGFKISKASDYQE